MRTLLIVLLTAPATARGDDPTADTLVERLGDPSFAVRSEAARRLQSLGPAALPACLDALDHPDPEVAERVRRVMIRGRRHVEYRASDARLLAEFAEGADDELRDFVRWYHAPARLRRARRLVDADPPRSLNEGLALARWNENCGFFETAIAHVENVRDELVTSGGEAEETLQRTEAELRSQWQARGFKPEPIEESRSRQARLEDVMALVDVGHLGEADRLLEPISRDNWLPLLSGDLYRSDVEWEVAYARFRVTGESTGELGRVRRTKANATEQQRRAKSELRSGDVRRARQIATWVDSWEGVSFGYFELRPSAVLSACDRFERRAASE